MARRLSPQTMMPFVFVYYNYESHCWGIVLPTTTVYSHAQTMMLCVYYNYGSHDWGKSKSFSGRGR